MNCTCKEWNSETAKQFLPMRDRGKFNFCPWCGSPLLPDPVEKTEWVMIAEYKNGRSVGSSLTNFKSTDAVGMEHEARLASALFSHEHPAADVTLKSITTIEKTLKIVRPK